MALKCLTEIGALKVGSEYDNKFIVLFNMVVASVSVMVPMSTGDASQTHITRLISIILNIV